MSAALSAAPPAPTAQRLLIGSVLVDTHSQRAFVDGAILPLTAAQYTVLETLALARGAIVSRETLCRIALHRNIHERKRRGKDFDRSIDQLVYFLRQKLPPDDAGQPLIRAVRIAGYWMPAGVAV